MYQWTFLIFLYLVGSLYINVLFPDLSKVYRQLLSPFFGIGFSALSVGLLLILRIPLSLLFFFMCLLVILYIAKVLITKPSLYTFSWNKIFYETLSNVISISFIFYAAAACFFVLSVIGNAGPDTTQFEATGRYLTQGGLVDLNTPQITFMLNGRLLIVGAMHAINRLFHGYSLYALNPTICVWLLFFLTYTFFMLNKKVDKIARISLIILFVITLGFYKRFFIGMFDIHSNQLAMIFFTLSIISLYLYLVSEEKRWVYIGSFLIGFACLTRVDMLLCSLIFFFLLTLIRKIDYKTLKYSWYIFLIILFPWRIFTLYYTPLDTWYANATQLYLLIGANFILFFLSILLHKYNRISFTLIRYSPFILGSIIILLLIIFSPEKVRLSWNLYIKYILFGHSTWLLLIISLVFSAFPFYYIGHRDENYYILFLPTLIYLFILFFLVAFSGYDSEDHSANRMVIHTVPLFIYSIFIALSTVITHKIKPSKGMFES